MTEIHHVINETLDGRAEKRVFTRSPTAVMSYELITMIVGFLSLAFIMNRNTETLRKKLDQWHEDTNQRLEKMRKETHRGLDELRKHIGRAFEEHRKKTGKPARSMQEASNSPGQK